MKRNNLIRALGVLHDERVKESLLDMPLIYQEFRHTGPHQ